ncbi:xanthine phosphoribosyltransferase [Candidatus Colimorpha enterica]|uniref:Xanthine phosphoribosyltransferase n=1 Tax=Candidatus Colimorpha enterica TaxID=3083063 RepID=R6U6G6_9BACT|nr:xanthine phosphoribosyltransferase [Candidatus Colimorpha enterica]
MKILEERIIKDGRVLPGNVLKVDSFLNHMIDVPFVCELGKEFRRLFETSGVTKILTIEASGIGLACLTAQYFGVPVVFAKKSRTSNISSEVYSTTVESYTHGNTNNVIVSKQYLGAGDRVLIIDDFLATGNALKGLIELCRLAGADVVGCGIAIEKRYQHGGDALRAENIRVESLALIDSMENGNIVFSQI